MPDLTHWGLFLTAALVLAITPGPGIFYVLTRSIRGGRREGIHSSLGTAVGGMVHVMAAALARSYSPALDYGGDNGNSLGGC
jgi:threonine/homoserine/homoserine lactone efflux protein